MSATKYNYRGYFKDINLNDYKLELYHDVSCGWKDITLLDVPITIEYQGSDDILYKTLKYSGATVGILTDGVDDYLFDIYSSTADDCKVTLYNSNNVVLWVGYVAPSLYSQGYESSREELSIDCNDGLSILKYFKYQSIDETPDMHSILDIILHCLQKSGCYSYLYFQQSVFLNTTDQTNILRKLQVNEEIFFDDDAEYDENNERITDDDDTYEDVLDKILTYLGMTMVADKDSVYIIDYDKIKSNYGIANYWKINISTGNEQETFVSNHPQISGNDYAENGQQISLTKVFNKVTVIDKFKTIESVLPDLYDLNHLTRFYPIEEYYPTIISTVKVDVLQVQTPNIGENGKTSGFYKFYNHDQYKFYAYNSNGTETTMRDKMIADNVTHGEQHNNILTGSTGIGCCICFCKTWEYGSIIDIFPEYGFSNTPGLGPAMGYFTYDKYLLFCLGKAKEYNTAALSDLNNNYYKPMFETNLQLNNIIGNNNMFLIFSGNFKYYDKANQFGLVEKYKREKDDWDRSKFWIPCKLYYQGQWWNGNSWQNTECRFKLYCDATETDHYLGKDMEIRNSVSWMWQINEKGTAVKLPSNILNDESPKFVMYTPASPDASYRLDQLWMKDFDIKLTILNQDNKEADDSDTAYTNIIDANNVEELDDIEMNICTYDDKNIAKNVVVVYDSNEYSNLDTVYQPAMNSILDPSTNGLARFEEILCCKIANQYQEPNIQLELTLNRNFSLDSLVYDKVVKKNFIIDKKSIDYRYQKYKYTLIEKR